MRVGVSAKVFLAYVVLLTAFVSTAAFSASYLNSARQHVLTQNPMLDVQTRLDGARIQLDAFNQIGRKEPRAAASYFVRAGVSLKSAEEGLELFLANETDGDAGRKTLQRYLGRLREARGLVEETNNSLTLLFGDPEGREAFNAEFKELELALNVLQRDLLREREQSNRELQAMWERAVRWALFLGVAGIAGAFAAGFGLWWTLRPLHRLRQRARDIAGGHYGQRIGLRSRDELGDLAREFDSMAQAIEEREQRLIASERLATVGKVAAQITHEIRNPLASIGLYAELLGDEMGEGDDKAEARRLLQAVSGEIDRLSEITESYLRFVRLPKPKLEREDPAQMVLSVTEFARAELRQAGIELTVDVAQDLPEIDADENQLRQALLNLIRNAKEAMPEGGRLRVELARREKEVVLRVSDTGAGIPADAQARIFEPFFSTKTKGTGLGLALVRQIVDEHGGQIDVASVPGAGTTFVLSFPVPPALEGERDAGQTRAPARAAQALAVPGSR